MLETLDIKNLALVEQLEISPGAAFNAVTGETGAGKSLILGALKLLAGWRTSAEIIRKGAKSCEVSGIFLLGNCALLERINGMLEQVGAPVCEEKRLLIKRVVTESGSRAYVNGSAVSVGWLKELGDLLVDIHGPHDNQTILQPAVQLSLLDDFAGNGDLLRQCAEIWEQWGQVAKKLASVGENALEPEEILLLKHQLQEIKGAGLNSGEEESLMQQYKLASHSRHLVELAVAMASGLSQGDNSIADQLGEYVRMAREIQEIDAEAGSHFQEALDGIFENIQDLSNEIEEYGSRLDIDEERLKAMEDRLDLIQRLKRKYGRTIGDVMAAADRIEERLQAADSVETSRAALEKRERELAAAYDEICCKLNASRRESAVALASAIERKLQNLGFDKAKFGIDIQNVAGTSNGKDGVEFTFSPNLGEDAHPLRKIASSGEIARVMLAVRTTLSAIDEVPILVFDEIDANIGGRVASVVAEELRSVGKQHQVFSITHLPLIAAAGDCHFLVSKHVDGQRTFAEIMQLGGEDRVMEIMRMMGAEADSESARQHALEMLAEGGKIKGGAVKGKKKTSNGKAIFSILLLCLFLAGFATGCGRSGAAGKLPLALAALQSGNYEEALRQAGICLRYDPDSIDALAIRGICQMRSGESTSKIKAVRDLERAHELAPGRKDIEYLYGLALYRNAQYPAAITVLTKLQTTFLHSNNKCHGAVLAMLGQSCNMCNNLQLGLNNLQFLQLVPQYQSRPEIYNLMAVMALKSRDYRQALTYLSKGLKVAPRDEAILQNVAVVYDLYLRQPDKARPFYLACHQVKQLRGDKDGCRRIEKRLAVLGGDKKR